MDCIIHSDIRDKEWEETSVCNGESQKLRLTSRKLQILRQHCLKNTSYSANCKWTAFIKCFSLLVGHLKCFYTTSHIHRLMQHFLVYTALTFAVFFLYHTDSHTMLNASEAMWGSAWTCGLRKPVEPPTFQLADNCSAHFMLHKNSEHRLHCIHNCKLKLLPCKEKLYVNNVQERCCLFWVKLI